MHGVDDVLSDAAFKRKATTFFLPIPLGREGTGGLSLRCSFLRIWFCHPHLGLSSVPS